jgi:hypothetical protein
MESETKPEEEVCKQEPEEMNQPPEEVPEQPQQPQQPLEEKVTPESVDEAKTTNEESRPNEM